MTTYRSNIWRAARHSNKAKELAYVTRGISDYFGSAAGDRGYQVTWATIEGTYGMTQLRDKKVILNPALLAKFGDAVPFTDKAVDTMQGVAVHEAGHALFGKFRAARNTYIAEIPGPHSRLIGNIVEDMLIDGPAFAGFNVGLARETQNLRALMAIDDLPAVHAAWATIPDRLTSAQLLNLWACSCLYDSSLAKCSAREFEYPFVKRLDTAIAVKKLRSPELLTDANNTLIAIGCAGQVIAKILAEYDDTILAKILEAEAEAEAEAESSPNESTEDGGNESGSGSGSGNGDDAMDGDTGDGGGSGDTDKPPGDEPGNSHDSDESGSGGTGAGGKAEIRIPEACPRPTSEETTNASFEQDEEFWSNVAREVKILETTRPVQQNRIQLAPFTDKKTVSAIRAAYEKLASEPSRQNHHDSGRIDRKRIAFATVRGDVFSRQRERTLDGTVVLLLDLSGSTRHSQATIKSAAASFYEALTGTGIDVHVFGYNDVAFCLATPKRVFGEFASVNADGGTDTTRGFDLVLDSVKVKPGASNVLIHITDGVPNNRLTTFVAMQKARDRGWKLINIGVGLGTLSLPYARVSDSQQNIASYKQVPTILAAAILDIVKQHKRANSVR